MTRTLLDLLMERVALEEGVVLLLLDALGDGLLVALGEVARSGFALFAGFSAFQGDGFLHGYKWVGGAKKGRGFASRNSNLSNVGSVLAPTSRARSAQAPTLHSNHSSLSRYLLFGQRHHDAASEKRDLA